MNIRKRHEATVNANTDACVAHEYVTPVTALNAAVIDLSGRYPDKGWTLNTTCTALLHVIQGQGVIMGEETAKDIAVDDQILIAPNEVYAPDGHMKVLYVATPAWTPEQAEHSM
jgi:hypothetical protein